MFKISLYIDNDLQYLEYVKGEDKEQVLKDHIDSVRIKFDDVFGKGEFDKNHTNYKYIIE